MTKKMLPNAIVCTTAKKNIIIDDTINLTRLIMCRRIRSVYARIRLSTHHGVTSMQIEERKNFRCPKNHGRIAFCFASAQQSFHILTLHAGRLMDYNLSTCLHTQHILHSFRIRLQLRWHVLSVG